MIPDHPASPFIEFVTERMRLKLPGSQWPGAALPEMQASFQCRPETLTLLCAEQAAAFAEPAGHAAVVEAQVRQLAGWLDDCSTATWLAAFAEPGAALDVAMDLQRGSRTGYRVALATASCLVARFQIAGRSWCTVVGSEVLRVEGLARRGPAGTVQLCPVTFARLETHLNSRHFGGLVAAEYIDETVLEASITIPPHASAALSTFAGLGLT